MKPNVTPVWAGLVATLQGELVTNRGLRAIIEREFGRDSEIETSAFAMLKTTIALREANATLNNMSSDAAGTKAYESAARHVRDLKELKDFIDGIWRDARITIGRLDPEYEKDLMAIRSILTHAKSRGLSHAIHGVLIDRDNLVSGQRALPAASRPELGEKRTKRLEAFQSLHQSVLEQGLPLIVVAAAVELAATAETHNNEPRENPLRNEMLKSWAREIRTHMMDDGIPTSAQQLHTFLAQSVKGLLDHVHGLGAIEMWGHLAPISLDRG